MKLAIKTIYLMLTLWLALVYAKPVAIIMLFGGLIYLQIIKTNYYKFLLGLTNRKQRNKIRGIFHKLS